MKKKLLVLAVCLMLTAGCAKEIPKLKNGEEAVVSLEQGKISVDDLYEEIKNTYGLTTLVNMVDKKILEDKYKDDLEEATKSADSQIASLEEYYGDDALSAVQQYTGYSTMEAYKDYLYLAYLQNLAVEDYAKEQIDDKQIEEYYSNEVKGDIEVSHILITPDVTDDMSDEDKTKAEDEAKKKAEELIKKLDEAEDKKATFETLAKENSDDEATSDKGGSLGYINTDTLSSDYGTFSEEAYKLEDGKYTTSPVKSSLGYHIILRTNTKEKAKLDDVKNTIIEKLAEELISNDNTTSVNALQALRKEYGMEINDSELNKQYSNFIQNSLAAAIEANSSQNEE